MIKLKLNRDQLFALCGFTLPTVYEAQVVQALKWGNVNHLDCLFNIIQIGEMVSKKYLYSNQHKNNIKLKYSEASSLLKHLMVKQWECEIESYECNVLITIKNELHQQLTNYQRRFNGNENRQNLLAGGGEPTGATHHIAAR